MERAPVERAPIDRAPKERAPIEKAPMERGPARYIVLSITHLHCCHKPTYELNLSISNHMQPIRNTIQIQPLELDHSNPEVI